jgi:hypothetical protein
VQLGEHQRRGFEHVAVRVAAVLVPAGVGVALAATVVLSGLAGVVEALAIELDGEVVGGPAAVDVGAGLCPPVRPRDRQRVLAQPLQEAVLQRTEGDREGARSMSVRGTVVIGMPRHSVPRSWLLVRWVSMPLILRPVGVLTVGGGGSPLISP